MAGNHRGSPISPPGRADERMRHPCADIILARVSKMITQQGRVERCSPSFNRVVSLQE